MQALIRSTLAVCLGLSGAAVAQAPMPSLDEALLVVDFKDAKWTPSTLAGIPPGVVGWTVAGDPKTGPAINYAKYPPGYVFPMHWHSYAEYTVVVSGMVHYVADGKPYDVVAGSFVIFPSKMRHMVSCNKAGPPCVVLIRRAGPVDYHFEP